MIMNMMTIEESHDVLRKWASGIYAQIYDKGVQNIAKRAFVDGMVFLYDVQRGKVREKDVTPEFFEKMQSNPYLDNSEFDWGHNVKHEEQ